MSLNYNDLDNIKSKEELNNILKNDSNYSDFFNGFHYSENPIVYNKVLEELDIIKNKQLVIDKVLTFSINNENKELFEKSVVLAKENNINLKNEELILKFVDRENSEFIDILKEHNSINPELANKHYSNTIRNPEILIKMYHCLDGNKNITQETLVGCIDKMFLRLDKEDYDNIKEFIIETNTDINDFIKKTILFGDYNKIKYLDENFKIENNVWLEAINNNIEDCYVIEEFGKEFSHNVMLDSISIKEDKDIDFDFFIDRKEIKVENSPFEYLLKKDFTNKDIELVLEKSLESNRLDLVKYLLLTENILSMFHNDNK